MQFDTSPFCLETSHATLPVPFKYRTKLLKGHRSPVPKPFHSWASLGSHRKALLVIVIAYEVCLPNQLSLVYAVSKIYRQLRAGHPILKRVEFPRDAYRTAQSRGKFPMIDILIAPLLRFALHSLIERRPGWWSHRNWYGGWQSSTSKAGTGLPVRWTMGRRQQSSSFSTKRNITFNRKRHLRPELPMTLVVKMTRSA